MRRFSVNKGSDKPVGGIESTAARVTALRHP